MRSFTQSLLRCMPIGAMLAAVLATPATVRACPLCKDAIAGDSVATALSATTLLLIAIPATLVLSIGGWIGFVYWRAARQATAVADTGDPAVVERPV